VELHHALAAVMTQRADVQQKVDSGLRHTQDMTWASTAERTREVIREASSSG
jgi:hypothetical protein